MFISRGMGKKDVVQLYNGILLSHKKEQTNTICSNMDDLETVILSEVSQTQKGKHITYMWNLKKGCKCTYIYNRSRVTDIENKLMVSWE